MIINRAILVGQITKNLEFYANLGGPSLGDDVMHVGVHINAFRKYADSMSKLHAILWH